MSNTLDPSSNELTAELEVARQRIAELEGELHGVQSSPRPATILGQQPHILLEKILSSLNDAVLLVDLTTRTIVECNQTTEKIFGHSREVLIGNEIRFLHVDEAMFERFSQEMRQSIAVQGYFETQFQLRRKNGEVFPTENFVTPIHDEKGALVAVVSVVRDITQRKRLEQERRSLEEKYSKAFNLSPDVLAISTLDTGEILELSQGFELTTGYSKEEAIGKTSKDLNLLWDASEREPVVDMLRLDGTVENIELRIRTKSGECLHGLFAAQTLHLVKGNCILTSFRDITERKKAEKALQDKEKMLQEQAKELEEVNATLTVLLKRRDQERQVYEKNALNTLKTLVFPFLEKLSASDLSPDQKSCLAVATTNLNSVYSPFADRLAFRGRSLTHSEIYIVELIRQGRTSKEIARSLGLSEETILTHRKNIRAKFGLQNQKVNLYSFLQSLENEPHD